MPPYPPLCFIGVHVINCWAVSAQPCIIFSTPGIFLLWPRYCLPVRRDSSLLVRKRDWSLNKYFIEKPVVTPPSLWPASSIPIWPNTAQYFSRRIPVTLRYSKKYPNHSEPFRCPNIAFQYIDLYLSTILRLLVLSLISSRTPNYLRYIKSHNS